MRQFVLPRRTRGLQRRNRRIHAAALRMIQQAMRIVADRRPRRHDDPIADRPYDRGVEDQKPPARKRRVQLLDPVPLMAGGFGAGYVIDLFPLSRHGSSPSWSGMAAASLNSFRLDGQKTYTSTTTNMLRK